MADHRLGRLDALTSLRFFAAAMIVVGHAFQYLGDAAMSAPFAWGQGVTFFFVLSGFILAYTYSELPTRSHVKNFWLARFARIWPLHIASLLLLLLALPNVPTFGWAGSGEFTVTLANLALLQAWIPSSKYFYSYNYVSWSISTEFFFYLLFPFLIYRWSSTWHIKIIISALLLLVLFAIGNIFQLSDASYPNGTWLIYINPMSRIFEFIVGIAACSIYTTRRSKSNQINKTMATGIEALTVLLLFLSLWFFIPGYAPLIKSIAGESVVMWWNRSGAVLLFALLIIVFAMQSGWLSRILQLRPFVLLGEISFSLFLVHQIVLRYHNAYRSEFSMIPENWLYGIYWLSILVISYFMYKVIERPCQRYIRSIPQRWQQANENQGIARIVQTLFYQAPWGKILPTFRLTTLLHGIGLFGIIFIVAAFPPIPLKLLSATEATHFARSSPYKDIQGATFGEAFKLTALNIAPTDGKTYKLKFIWYANKDAELKYRIAVHLVDKSGKIIVNLANIPQHQLKLKRRSGVYWFDEISVPRRQLDQASAIALVIWNPPNTLLPVSGGVTDWNGRRLIIRLKNYHKKPASR